jgi:hypothetical protein
MKRVFLGLVLCNVVLFLWATGHHAPPPATTHTPRPAINGEGMRPLDAAAATAPSAVTPVTPRPQPAPATAQTKCYAVGPFTSNQSARQAGRLLAGSGYTHTARTEAERVIDGYRVVVGPFASADAIAAMRKRLDSLGLRDQYVLKDGLQTQIALGFFSQLDSAEHFVADLAAKGVTADLKARTHAGQGLTWLDVVADDAGNDTQAKLQAMDWGEPKVKVQEQPCSSR